MCPFYFAKNLKRLRDQRKMWWLPTSLVLSTYPYFATLLDFNLVSENTGEEYPTVELGPVLDKPACFIIKLDFLLTNWPNSPKYQQIVACVTISIVPLLWLRTQCMFRRRSIQCNLFACFISSSVCWQLTFRSSFAHVLRSIRKDCVRTETSQVGTKIQPMSDIISSMVLF